MPRGNATTRDKVIRRKVYALPGERVDMKQVQRSITYLNRTRFFQDPLTLAGPRFEFLKTDRDDVLDLAIDVTESETGDIRWGAGISSGAGAQATFEFRKRNFDLWRPPSSWNPITMFGEILDNRAFHGGGQTLDLLLAPGTQVSQGSIGYTEPDLFGEQFETTELRVNGHRTLRSRDGYRSDAFKALLRALESADDAERIRVLQAIQRRIADDAVNVFLYEFPKLGVWRKELQGVWLDSPTQANDLTQAYWAPA